MALISVIIPVYNTERYVEECLRSVFAQTMRDFDVIIVDDCSTDGTMSIVRNICDESAADINVTIISTHKTSGASVARNLGIEISDARYLYFVDSDDYISNNSLEKLSRIVKLHPGVQMVYSGASVFGNSNYIETLDIASKKQLPEFINNAKEASKIMLKHWLLPDYIWNRLFLREWLNQHSLRFKPDILAEDLHLKLYMARHIETIAFCKDTTYFYRYNDNNVSHTKKAFLKACAQWVICDWTRHLTLKNLRAQLTLLLHLANDSYLMQRGPDAPLPPLWRKIPGALLHWARLMRRYGREIPKENNINQ